MLWLWVLLALVGLLRARRPWPTRVLAEVHLLNLVLLQQPTRRGWLRWARQWLGGRSPLPLCLQLQTRGRQLLEVGLPA